MTPVSEIVIVHDWSLCVKIKPSGPGVVVPSANNETNVVPLASSNSELSNLNTVGGAGVGVLPVPLRRAQYVMI